MTITVATLDTEAGEWRCADGHLNGDRFSVCCVCDLNDEGEPTRRPDDEA